MVTNSVHAVLRNWDILQVIMNFMKHHDFGSHSGRRDLVAVALVCREFCDLALDILWRDADIRKIILLFPMDIIRLHPRGEESLTCIPAAPQQWERFDAYASRIRALSLSFLTNDLFLCGVRTRYPTFHHPFPNLTRLQWESTPSEVMDVMTLICPTLTEVLLSIDEDPKEDEHDDKLADVLRSLGNTCPRLKNFGYTHSWTLNNRSKAVEISLIYLIRQCGRLENVHLPVSRDILRALGSLPHLSMLQLDYVEWEDGSQLYLPIQADKWIEEADRFPVLDDLTISGSHTVSSLTECFQDSGCFPRASFAMCEMFECDQWSTLAIAEFFRGILRPERREGLLDLWIDRDPYVGNLVGYDTWQSLLCLSSIPNLHTFSLNGLFLDIKDSDLEQIAQIWPALHSLSLDVSFTDDYQSQISFQGLAHLSRLQNLEDVTLMLAPDSTISESMLSPSLWSNSRLSYLTIRGKLPPITPCAAAMFLILHFPRLKMINGSFYLDKREKELIQEIQVLLDAARPRMENLLSVRCGLISGTGIEQDGDED